MDSFLPFVICVGGFAVVLGFLTWLAVHVRRRGLAGGAMSAALASYEEAFRAGAHESHVEIRAQAERKSPLLSPDDHWGRRPVEDGRAGTAAGRLPTQRGSRRSRRGLGRRWGRLRSGH